MKHLLCTLLFLFGSLLEASTKCMAPTSEFHLDGNFLLGGLFDIHDVRDPIRRDKPEALDCSSQLFSFSNYRRFQLLRFAVEEINNSTSLLPNVTLGYDVFDHCSDTISFPNVFSLLSTTAIVPTVSSSIKNRSKIIAVLGPFTSSQALTVAPLFMVDLIPMVNYATSSSVFSKKAKFPSFLRTVHPNTDTIEVIFTLINHFNWRWVAFLYADNDYGNDGLDIFRKRIRNTKMCLAYTKGLSLSTDWSLLFEQIQGLRIRVIIVFGSGVTVEALIESAMALNVTDKVWIANEAWSLNKRLPKMKGIENIGTVLGVAQPVETIPGFHDFIRHTKATNTYDSNGQGMFCNEIFNCSAWSEEVVIGADPTYSFPVYSAVYAVAHALHHVLECDAGGCKDIRVYPEMVLAELQKSNFTLLNRTIQFDKNGDIRFGSYTLIAWDQSGDAKKIGFYQFYPKDFYFINESKITWNSNGKVPTSSCSPECSDGYVRKQHEIQRCCFTCVICPNGTYVNATEDPYRCIRCKETEWSSEGSTSCTLRLVEFIPFTDGGALAIMGLAGVLMSLTLAVSVLFAINYNTPVVRSAGGPMCFLILGCLSLCSLSVFFYFGKPTDASCVLRYFLFILLYTVCLACFVVRSFQIVCIFKISATFPKLQTWWSKYYGQWLLISLAFVVQAASLAISFSHDPPRPYNETSWKHDQTVLFCSLNLGANSFTFSFLLLMCCLCFVFSYMAKDLPKNYNEAKALTFCLLLLVLTWIVFLTVFMLYKGKYIQTFNALAVLSSLYSFLLWYFLPKCYIILFQSHKNTSQYFQGLIQSYTKTMSQ